MRTFDLFKQIQDKASDAVKHLESLGCEVKISVGLGITIQRKPDNFEAIDELTTEELSRILIGLADDGPDRLTLDVWRARSTVTCAFKALCEKRKMVEKEAQMRIYLETGK